MELGAGIENETLQNLIRDCLLELNRLKFNLTELEIAKAKDTTPQKIQELENHILSTPAFASTAFILSVSVTMTS